jgi:hypothetical protein
MINYSKLNNKFLDTQIYLLKCQDLVYVGRTTQLLKFRFTQHKTDYKTRRTCSSKLLFDLNKPIEKETLLFYPCVNEYQAKMIERYFILKFKDLYGDKCVNIIIPTKFKNKKEYDNNKKEKKKEFYKDNKEQWKEYYEINKETINQKIQCKICYKFLLKRNLKRHTKTKHKEIIKM